MIRAGRLPLAICLPQNRSISIARKLSKNSDPNRLPFGTRLPPVPIHLSVREFCLRHNRRRQNWDSFPLALEPCGWRRGSFCPLSPSPPAAQPVKCCQAPVRKPFQRLVALPQFSFALANSLTEGSKNRLTVAL